ncbi:MAG: hypothetical protein AAB518_01815 [Patescibacteria group bacterium]
MEKISVPASRTEAWGRARALVETWRSDCNQQGRQIALSKSATRRLVNSLECIIARGPFEPTQPPEVLNGDTREARGYIGAWIDEARTAERKVDLGQGNARDATISLLVERISPHIAHARQNGRKP